MLKLSGSFYRLLFATLLVLFCLNGQQLVYASNLVLDKDHLNAVVEVTKIVDTQTTAATSSVTGSNTATSSVTGSNTATSSVTGSSTATHKFDLKFDVGKANDYKSTGKSFKLAIGKSCNLDIVITEISRTNKLSFQFNNGPTVNELESLTITNEKITTRSNVARQPPVDFCDDPQDPASGGSIMLENPANDPGKSTIELTISGDATDVSGFKLTSDVQIYVPPTPPSSIETTTCVIYVDDDSEDSDAEGGFNYKPLLIGIAVFIALLILGGIGALFYIFVIKDWRNKKNDDGKPEKKKESEKENEQIQPK